MVISSGGKLVEETLVEGGKEGVKEGLKLVSLPGI